VHGGFLGSLGESIASGVEALLGSRFPFACRDEIEA